MTREELIELVQKIINAEGVTEQENDLMLEQFLANVPDPNAANYIFDPEYEELTAKDIVKKALAYRPIRL